MNFILHLARFKAEKYQFPIGYIDMLVQERHDAIANALELLLSFLH